MLAQSNKLRSSSTIRISWLLMAAAAALPTGARATAAASASMPLSTVAGAVVFLLSRAPLGACQSGYGSGYGDAPSGLWLEDYISNYMASDWINITINGLSLSLIHI